LSSPIPSHPSFYWKRGEYEFISSGFFKRLRMACNLEKGENMNLSNLDFPKHLRMTCK
jgi:hypothetical protein